MEKAYDEGRFHLLDGILYHRTKHTCVMSSTDKTLRKTILHECHVSVAAGHLSEDRTLERVKTCSWWPNWKKDVSEYCQKCDRCQKANRPTGKEFGMMIQLQELKSPWEIVNMDWVTALPPGGDRSYNAWLVLVDRYRKTLMFLPCHQDNTAMDTVTTMEIHPLGPQYGLSMPYPIYGNLAISIIIDQIGHCHVLWP
ncbi:hypothetical protein O181_046372 [Austropuccinia psidii MF-1]|uniref:Integrase zinc-binding domain-containing protein n=1 Tax=Austropuccinia psidii MF-1 TaxID=1389203 RepID=A0A9Q3DVP9_9BASI|nr:hypothetical protein [Austropuccinia psidii MF-1]